MTIGERNPGIVDEQDLALQQALAGLQDTVSRHLREAGQNIDDLTTEEHQQLVDRIRPYLKFELAASDAIWPGMPFEASGNGGFLVADAAGNICGAQRMTESDSLIGLVDDVWPYPVPSLRCMTESTDEDDEVPSYEQSLSATIVLEQTRFHCQSTDGETSAVYNLSQYQVIVPIIYGLRMAMASHIRLEQ